MPDVAGRVRRSSWPRVWTRRTSSATSSASCRRARRSRTRASRSIARWARRPRRTSSRCSPASRPRSKDDALAARRKGDKRKIVISTNLAETSLTVEGVRFVVDTGAHRPVRVEPRLAQGGMPTKPHSQAGIRQRWGRVGRKAPGWVFPLYTKGQFLEPRQDTPPGSTRENLEALMMTARLGGIDDVVGFPWPAAFEPKTSRRSTACGQRRSDIFKTELSAPTPRCARRGGRRRRTPHRVRQGTHPLLRPRLVTSAMAILYADRLGCVPEVATSSRCSTTTGWSATTPCSWTPSSGPTSGASKPPAGTAASRPGRGRRAPGAADHGRVGARRTRACPPGSPRASGRLGGSWWVSDAVLLAAAVKRQEILAALSPAMKEEVKRFVEPALLDRTRGVLTRALQAQIYDTDSTGVFTLGCLSRICRRRAESAQTTHLTTSSCRRPDAEIAGVARGSGAGSSFRRGDCPAPSHRPHRRRDPAFGNNPDAPDGRWKASSRTVAADAMRLLVRGAMHAAPDPSRNAALGLILAWPAGTRALCGSRMAVWSSSRRRSSRSRSRRRRRAPPRSANAGARLFDEDGSAARRRHR